MGPILFELCLKNYNVHKLFRLYNTWIQNKSVILTRKYYFYKFLHCFLHARNVQTTSPEKPRKKIKRLKKDKYGYLTQFLAERN